MLKMSYTVLGEEERLSIMESSLPSLVRIGRAFPSLIDDLLHLLVMYGRVGAAHSALSTAPSPHSIGKERYFIFIFVMI